MADISISKIGKTRAFRENLRFDVTPELLFKPRFANTSGNEEFIKETQGFSFYVEYMEGMDKPALMVMKTYRLTSKSIAQVTDAPEELLWGAVRESWARDIMGMYPLSKPLEDWIRSQIEAQAEKTQGDKKDAGHKGGNRDQIRQHHP